MRPTKILAAALILGLGMPALAGSAPDAAAQEKITANLTADGYEVRKIDTEDGMIEVYAVKDGKMFEIYLDSDLKVVRTNEKG